MNLKKRIAMAGLAGYALVSLAHAGAHYESMMRHARASNEFMDLHYKTEGYEEHYGRLGVQNWDEAERQKEMLTDPTNLVPFLITARNAREYRDCAEWRVADWGFYGGLDIGARVSDKISNLRERVECAVEAASYHAH